MEVFCSSEETLKKIRYVSENNTKNLSGDVTRVRVETPKLANVIK